MTITFKSETFRNTDDNCTILIEQYGDKPHFTKFWRYAYKYDYMSEFVVVSESLLTKPRKSRLVDMF